MNRDKIYRELTSSFFDNNRLTFGINLLLRLLLGVCDLIVAYMIMIIIDLAIGISKFTLSQVIVFCVLLVGFRCMILFTMRYTYAAFLRKAVSQYRKTAFAYLIKKEIGSFGKEYSRTYLSALTNDINMIEREYLENVFLVIEQCLIFIAALFIMFYENVLLTLLAIAFAFFPFLISIITGERLAKAEKEVSERNERFVGLVNGFLSGFSVIKSFHMEEQAIRQFEEENMAAENMKYQKRLTMRLIGMLGSISSDFSQFGVFLAGAYLVLSGKGVTPGMITMFLQMMNHIVGPISSVPPMLAARKAAYTLVKKLSDSLEEHQTGKEGIILTERMSEGLNLTDVTFSYADGSLALDHVTVGFEKGKRYAVIGPSGSGKTTLLRILMGALGGYEGKIQYDGTELSEIDPGSLYEKMAVVEQNVFLFQDTIRNNITMYRDVDEDNLTRVIRLSGLEDFINKNGDTYDCGENGRYLSGGERQRVSIARSLLMNREIMLFDEATSALDPLVARQIMQSILSLNDVTRIMVTHKLDAQTLAEFDEIIVLRKGSICERGTFEELIEKKSFFYALYMMESTASADNPQKKY